MTVRALPRARRARHVPVRAPRGGAGAAARRRRRADRLRHGRAARGDARVHPRGAGGGDHAGRAVPERRSGCPSCARRSRAGRGAASASRSTRTRRSIPTLGSKEAVFGLAHVFDGELVAIPQPAYPVYDRGARFAGKEIVELPLREENGWLPDLDGVDWDRVAVLLAQLPEQPDRRDRAARVLRAAPPRWPASTASCSPPTRRTRSSTSATAPVVRAAGRATCSHVAVFNTLSKRSSMPGYRSGLRRRRPGHRRRAEALPARTSASRRPELLPARGDRGLERRGARRRGARALPGQARRPAAGAGGARACAARAATRRSSSGSRAPTSSPRAGSSRASSSRPGSFFGAAGEGYLRLALVPPLEAIERALELIAP